MVVVPTYIERENLSALVEQILALPLDVQIVVVDDNSPDGTGALADELASKNARVKVLHRLTERGRASAGIAGFKHALADPSIELIVEMDADFSHDPQDIPRLVRAAEHHDVAIGSRYVPGGQQINCTPRNIFFSRLINLVNRTAFGIQVRDSSGGFKCYRRRVLETIRLDNYVATEFSVGLETLVKVKNNGFTMVELPIVFRNRTRGPSKANWHVLTEYPLTLMRLKLSALRQPLK
jgi:dolichol-phosphate mannosyltransferase